MISVTGLTKIFDDYKALENVTCQIPEGCIYGMVGSNGAGKSTFLRLISGIYKSDAGKIEVDGQDVYENVEMKNKIAFVPDDFPGSPVVRTPCLHCWGHRFDLWSGN